MTFVQTKPFRKAFARLGPQGQSAVEAAVQQFKVDRLDASLRDHALKAKMKGLRAFSAGWDVSVIHRREGAFMTITLMRAGARMRAH
jgi:mRNA-degrading endonuclease YafQ of YafQ-DinJ toxin-antitoxin module